MSERPYTFRGSVALQARVRLGLTQRDVAERCGIKVSDSNISKYERGVVAPSPPVLAVLAITLGLTVDDLITFREDAA